MYKLLIQIMQRVSIYEFKMIIIYFMTYFEDYLNETHEYLSFQSGLGKD